MAEARDVHHIDVTKVGGQLLRIHDRMLSECCSRCKQYTAHMSAFQKKMEEELEEAKQNGLSKFLFNVIGNTHTVV